MPRASASRHRILWVPCSISPRRTASAITIPLIALTGSCGKTTVKDFCAALLATRYEVVKTQGNLNNEIGCPLSLLQIDESTDRAVIEMGANHPGEIARLCAIARPEEAAVTLVGPGPS